MTLSLPDPTNRAYPDFSICGIPHYISGEVTHWSDLAHRIRTVLEATGLDLRLETLATSIDVAGHGLYLAHEDGTESVRSYDELGRRYGCRAHPAPSTASRASARLTGCTCCTQWATRSP